MKTVYFFETAAQASEAKQAFINEFDKSKFGVIAKNSSFTDRYNDIECCDEFTLNLSWSGECACEVVTIYCKDSYDDVDEKTYASWN